MIQIHQLCWNHKFSAWTSVACCNSSTQYFLIICPHLQSESVSDEEGELQVAEDGQALETRKERRMRQQKEKQARRSATPLNVRTFNLHSFHFILCPEQSGHQIQCYDHSVSGDSSAENFL